MLNIILLHKNTAQKSRTENTGTLSVYEWLSPSSNKCQYYVLKIQLWGFSWLDESSRNSESDTLQHLSLLAFYFNHSAEQMSGGPLSQAYIF